jgi:hypothetical protein
MSGVYLCLLSVEKRSKLTLLQLAIFILISFRSVFFWDIKSDLLHNDLG